MKRYCVYLTIYSGQKLPPFYIGSTSVSHIKQKNYHGTVGSLEYKKIWETEIKHNPQLFKTSIISLHETREEAYIKEEKLQRQLNVINSKMYINACYANKSFSRSGIKEGTEIRIKKRTSALRRSAETNARIGAGQIGNRRSEKTKEKQRQKAIGRIVTEESRKNMSVAQRKRDPSTRFNVGKAGKGIKKSAIHRKNLSIANKGKIPNTARKVKCIELDMIFQSGNEAARYIGLKCSSDIHRAAKRGKGKSGGFSWKYI